MRYIFPSVLPISVLFALIFLPMTVATAQMQKGAMPLIPVIVNTVVTSELVETIEAMGTLKSNESVEITSSVSEVVTAIHFDDGQRVKKGDLLIELEHGEEKSLLAEEKFRVEEAERQVNRIAPLAKQGAAPKSQLDEKQRELATARARLDALQSRLDKLQIKAPFDGVVGLRMVSVGAFVQTGSVITTLQDDQKMKLDFTVPSVYLPYIQKGMEIVVHASAFGKAQPFKGYVSAVDNHIDPETRSFVARAMLSNDEGFLKSGLLMRVLLKKPARNAIFVPEEAIVPEGRKDFIYVLNEAQKPFTVKKVAVTLGLREYGRVEVTSGLTVGDRIVTHGTLRIRDNTPVVIKGEQIGDEPLADMIGENNTPPAPQKPKSQSEAP